MYADDLVLCGQSEEDLKAIVGWFVEVHKRRRLKVNAGKSKMMVRNGEEGLEYKVNVDGIHLEHLSELKYLGCVLENQVQTRQCVVGGLWEEGCRCINFIINARDLQLEYIKSLA